MCFVALALFSWAVALPLLLSLLAFEANAAEIAIVNPSFEVPAIAGDGDFVGGSPTGWTCVVEDGCGVWNPASNSISAEAHEGFNVGYFGRSPPTNGLSQVLTATLLPNTVYLLRVWVARRKESPGFYPNMQCGIRLDADAGATVLASTSCLDAADQNTRDTWFLREITFKSTDAHPIGTNLRILISGIGSNAWQLAVDDVSLTATEKVPTLSAPTLSLLAAAVLGIGFWASRSERHYSRSTD